MVEGIRTPVSAKIRIGWDSQGINGVSVSQKLQSLGVAAVSVHGRTVVQKFGGKANWEILRHIKEKLSIPLIGNGDVRNSGRAKEMLERTGCDFVMIGRRAMGDPWFFARCKRKLGIGKTEIPDPKESFFRFLEYYKRFDRNKSFNELRTHALWFAKRGGLGPGARRKISQLSDVESIRAMFK
jgi:tRNA-dihydrouridine synthase